MTFASKVIGSEGHFIIVLRTASNSDGIAYPIAERFLSNVFLKHH